MAKKVYCVRLVCKATASVDVVAESEDEARALGMKWADRIDQNRYDFENTECECEEKNVACDIGTLYAQAKMSIRSEVGNDGDAVSFNSVEVAKTEYEMSGGRVVDEYDVPAYIDSAYINESDDELYVQFEGCTWSDQGYDDEPLSELSESEQYKVLEAILGR